MNRWSDRYQARKYFLYLAVLPNVVVITVSCCLAGVIIYRFQNSGEKIKAGNYCQQTDEMHQKLRRMCRRLVNMNGAVLLLHNAGHKLHS